MNFKSILTNLKAKGASRDLAIILLLSVFIFILAAIFDFLESVVSLTKKLGIWQIDELIIVLIFLLFASCVFSFRRWHSLRFEVVGRKRAEEALHKQQEFLQAVLDNVEDGIVACNADGVLTLFNRATRDFHGLPETPIPADEWADHYDLYLPDGITRMSMEQIPLFRALQCEPVQNVEMVIAPKHGQTRTLLASGRALFGSHGEKLGALVVMHDITERKRAEMVQSELENQLRHAQKMKAIGTLAGGIAHDFNNILGAVMGYTELVAHDLQENKTAMFHLGQVLTASNRAKELVKQMLTFSRQQEGERKPVQLQPVIKEALQLLRATIPSTIEIRQQIDSQAPSILGDPTQVHQVIMNLCTNAWHAIGEHGGIIDVCLTTVDIDADFAKTNTDLKEGKYLQLMISDSGRGMDQATRERIFEPFFTTKRPGEGTGLGLSVVHGVVKKHEGAISVYSGPDQGTCFMLYFPIYESRETEASQECNSVPKGRGERILFVDDDEPLAIMGQRMLERLGYQVTFRTSSLDALEVFRAQPDLFDLVVTDQTMPFMDGAHLATELLTIRPTLPVIMVTGFSTTINPEIAQAMNIRELILKPYTAQSLGEAVHRELIKGENS